MADGSRKVTSIFVRERDPLTSARSVAEAHAGRARRVRATFGEMDVDGSGQIGAEELVAALALIDKPASAAEAQAMIDEVGADSDGGVWTLTSSSSASSTSTSRRSAPARRRRGRRAARARARARGRAQREHVDARAARAGAQRDGRGRAAPAAASTASRPRRPRSSRGPAFDHFVIGCILLVGVATIVALEGEGWTGAKARGPPR